MRITFFAKRRAEEAPGVGSSTDMWFVVRGGAYYFEPQSKVIRALEEMFFKQRMAAMHALYDDATELNTVLFETFNDAAPRAATPEEREAAEKRAEEADEGGIVKSEPEEDADGKEEDAPRNETEGDE
jgi:hypothetical protein